MEITTTQIPIARPEAATPPSRELREACRQFEAIFIRRMLEESLAPLHAKPNDSLGAGSGVHRYMVADVLANQLSKSGVFGIADMLQARFQFSTDSSNQSLSPEKR